MVKLDLAHVQVFRKRLSSGERWEYHQIRGVKGSTFWKCREGEKPDTDEYHAAYKQAARPRRSADRFGSIVDAYFDSGEFRMLSPRTKKDYRRWADEIRTKFGSAPIAAFELAKIRQVAMSWRDQWDGRNADYAWTVLRLIVSWAYERGLLREHHLRGGGRRYTTDRSDIIWTESDVSAIEEGGPPHVARLLRAAVETALRPGDLVKLGRQHIHQTPLGRRLQVRTAKRGRIASIPVTPAMGRLIDETPAGRMLLLVNAKGLPWTEEAASKAVMRARKAVGLRDELRLYDARGAGCTRLLRARATLSEIAMVMGWSPAYAAKMLAVYAALDPAASDEVLVRLNEARNV